MPDLVADGRMAVPSATPESGGKSVEPLRRLTRRLAFMRPSKGATIALALLITLAATYGDTVTSAATTFTLFYVMALGIGTWFSGLRTGYVISLSAVIGSSLASVLTLQRPPSLWFVAWNAALDLVLYAGCVKILWALRQRLEREALARQDALDQLRHAERLTTVGKLAAGIAHEIGTPLNVISGRAELIARGTLAGDAIKHSAQIVIEQTERVSKIIRQLLDFARRGGTQVTRTDITDLVETTVLLLSTMATKAGVSIAHSGTLVEAAVNRSEMQQVLTNLLTNAIHASNRGGSIELTTRLDKVPLPNSTDGRIRTCAVIQITDHGTGIAPDVLPKIFDPFFTTKELGSGTGLGLSVAYGIVRDHQGWITVDSQVGAGTTVAVFVPQVT